jgi:hypothetical protein
MEMESVGEVQTDKNEGFSSGSSSQLGSSKDVDSDMEMESVGDQSSGKQLDDSIEESEGKERLREELEDRRKEEQQPEKATLKADKAKIKHSEDDHRDLTELQQKVSDRSDGTAEEVETGDGLQQILENIQDDSDQLVKEDVDEGQVYSELEAEMEALKNEIVERSVDDRMKRQIFDTLDMVENSIEKSESSETILDKTKGFLGIG